MWSARPLRGLAPPQAARLPAGQLLAAKQKQPLAAVDPRQLPAGHQEQPEPVAEVCGTGARVARAQTAAKQPQAGNLLLRARLAVPMPELLVHLLTALVPLRELQAPKRAGQVRRRNRMASPASAEASGTRNPVVQAQRLEQAPPELSQEQGLLGRPDLAAARAAKLRRLGLALQGRLVPRVPARDPEPLKSAPKLALRH